MQKHSVAPQIIVSETSFVRIVTKRYDSRFFHTKSLSTSLVLPSHRKLALLFLGLSRSVKRSENAKAQSKQTSYTLPFQQDSNCNPISLYPTPNLHLKKREHTSVFWAGFWQTAVLMIPSHGIFGKKKQDDIDELFLELTEFHVGFANV